LTLESEPDTVVVNGVRYWVRKAFHPQPKSDSMLPEIENPPLAPSQQAEFGRNLLSRLAKPAVRPNWNVSGSRLKRG